MGCAAEIITLDDVRASRQRQVLRQKLHERFDRWLDELEPQLPETESTLAQVSETIWALRLDAHRRRGPDNCRAYSRGLCSNRTENWDVYTESL